MMRSFDLRQKKVIDADTAEKIGYIRDMDIDFENGRINSVTIPKGGILGMLGDKGSITVPWENVQAIGREYVIIKQTGKTFGKEL